MKKVYICSPYRGDTETNIQNARKYCRAAVEMGCLPIAPHLLFPQFLDDDNPRERERGMARAMELLSICDEVWVFGIDNLSEGMEKEVNWADSKSIPVMDGFDMIGYFHPRPTREKVEKLQGEVNKVDKFLYACSKCGTFIDKGDSFCCRCGAPLTGEAVDILMKRLEALFDETKAD